MATYYISHSSGNDANSGATKLLPWLRHPYMQGFSGSYSHAAGDIFIFRQGDSWPNACFDMVIQAGGTNGNPDQYTFDPTWGTPGGTTGNTGQAVGMYQFTAGGSVINGTDGYNRFIYDNGNNYITFNGIEFTGMTWTGTGGSYGNVDNIDIQMSTHVIVSNCWFHGWTHPGATSDAWTGVAGNGNSPYNIGCRVTGCVFDGSESGGAGVSDSGAATYAIPLSDNNIILNMSNGLLLNANGVCYNNLIGPIHQSFDSSNHENAIEPIDVAIGGTSTVYIYNNVWHDSTAVGVLTQGAGPSASNEIDYLWNNVAYVGSTVSPPIPLQFDSVMTPNTGSEVHTWNNTIVGGSGASMRTINRGNGNFSVLELQNNHCISDVAAITLGITGNTYTNIDTLLQSVAVATAAGYTSSETYAYSPTSVASPTVGAGANLTSIATGMFVSLAYDTTYGGTRTPNARPATGAWDIGAYEYSAAALAPSPASISSTSDEQGFTGNVTVTGTNFSTGTLFFSGAGITVNSYSVQNSTTVTANITISASAALTARDAIITNADSQTGTLASAFTVTAAAVAPSITSQPVSQSVTVGQTATFSVSATGTVTLTYQWSENGVTIGSATSASYTTPVTATGGSGAQFTVTITNSVGSVTSNTATLTVTAPAPVIPQGTAVATPLGLSFMAGLEAINPPHQIVRVSHTKDKRWTVRNETLTPWFRITPNAGNGRGFFDVSVNIYDPSVIIGVQTGLIFIEFSDQTIQVTVTLSVSAV